MAEEVDGVGAQWSGDITTVEVDTLWEAKTCRPGTTFLNCISIRISQVSASRIKEFYCIWTL
jgi:hypothetical protein